MLDRLFKRDILPRDPEKLGTWGEKFCERYLRRQGMRKIAANFRCKTGEIDLIMADTDRTLVFVEVKTRASEEYSEAENAITNSKKQRMIRAARYFLKTHEVEDRAFRFDAVIIVGGQNRKAEIRHYRNAFLP